MKCHVTKTNENLEVPNMEMSCDNDQKNKQPRFRKCHVTMTRNESCKRNSFQLKNRSLTLFVKNFIHFFSATILLSHSHIASNTTSFLEKLTCTDYVDFGKIQDKSGEFFCLKLTSTAHMLNLKCSRRTTTKFLPGSNSHNRRHKF